MTAWPKAKPVVKVLWAAKWRSRNKLDGTQVSLDVFHGCVPKRYFTTRRECEEWINHTYSYFNRPDLRAEPHGWRMPVTVRVKVTVREI